VDHGAVKEKDKETPIIDFARSHGLLKDLQPGFFSNTAAAAEREECAQILYNLFGVSAGAQ
jgi:hypothetical protein